MLKIMMCAVLAIGLVSAAKSQLPPETGKFFYADFKHGTGRGKHLLEAYTGSTKAYNPLMLTTEEYKVGIFTS